MRAATPSDRGKYLRIVSANSAGREIKLRVSFVEGWAGECLARGHSPDREESIPNLSLRWIHSINNIGRDGQVPEQV